MGWRRLKEAALNRAGERRGMVLFFVVVALSSVLMTLVVMSFVITSSGLHCYLRSETAMQCAYEGFCRACAELMYDAWGVDEDRAFVCGDGTVEYNPAPDEHDLGRLKSAAYFYKGVPITYPWAQWRRSLAGPYIHPNSNVCGPGKRVETDYRWMSMYSSYDHTGYWSGAPYHDEFLPGPLDNSDMWELALHMNNGDLFGRTFGNDGKANEGDWEAYAFPNSSSCGYGIRPYYWPQVRAGQQPTSQFDYIDTRIVPDAALHIFRFDLVNKEDGFRSTEKGIKRNGDPAQGLELASICTHLGNAADPEGGYPVDTRGNGINLNQVNNNYEFENYPAPDPRQPDGTRMYHYNESKWIYVYEPAGEYAYQMPAKLGRYAVHVRPDCGMPNANCLLDITEVSMLDYHRSQPSGPVGNQSDYLLALDYAFNPHGSFRDDLTATPGLIKCDEPKYNYVYCGQAYGYYTTVGVTDWAMCASTRLCHHAKEHLPFVSRAEVNMVLRKDAFDDVYRNMTGPVVTEEDLAHDADVIASGLSCHSYQYLLDHHWEKDRLFIDNLGLPQEVLTIKSQYMTHYGNLQSTPMHHPTGFQATEEEGNRTRTQFWNYLNDLRFCYGPDDERQGRWAGYHEDAASTQSAKEISRYAKALALAWIFSSGMSGWSDNTGWSERGTPVAARVSDGHFIPPDVYMGYGGSLAGYPQFTLDSGDWQDPRKVVIMNPYWPMINEVGRFKPLSAGVVTSSGVIGNPSGSQGRTQLYHYKSWDPGSGFVQNGDPVDGTDYAANVGWRLNFRPFGWNWTHSGEAGMPILPDTRNGGRGQGYRNMFLEESMEANGTYYFIELMMPKDSYYFHSFEMLGGGCLYSDANIRQPTNIDNAFNNSPNGYRFHLYVQVGNNQPIDVMCDQDPWTGNLRNLNANGEGRTLDTRIICADWDLNKDGFLDHPGYYTYYGWWATSDNLDRWYETSVTGGPWSHYDNATPINCATSWYAGEYWRASGVPGDGMAEMGNGKAPKVSETSQSTHRQVQYHNRARSTAVRVCDPWVLPMYSHEVRNAWGYQSTASDLTPDNPAADIFRTRQFCYDRGNNFGDTGVDKAGGADQWSFNDTLVKPGTAESAARFAAVINQSATMSGSSSRYPEYLYSMQLASMTRTTPANYVEVLFDPQLVPDTGTQDVRVFWTAINPVDDKEIIIDSTLLPSEPVMDYWFGLNPGHRNPFGVGYSCCWPLWNDRPEAWDHVPSTPAWRDLWARPSRDSSDRKTSPPGPDPYGLYRTPTGGQACWGYSWPYRTTYGSHFTNSRDYYFIDEYGSHGCGSSRTSRRDVWMHGLNANSLTCMLPGGEWYDSRFSNTSYGFDLPWAYDSTTHSGQSHVRTDLWSNSRGGLFNYGAENMSYLAAGMMCGDWAYYSPHEDFVNWTQLANTPLGWLPADGSDRDGHAQGYGIRWRDPSMRTWRNLARVAPLTQVFDMGYTLKYFGELAGHGNFYGFDGLDNNCDGHVDDFVDLPLEQRFYAKDPRGHYSGDRKIAGRINLNEVQHPAALWFAALHQGYLDSPLVIIGRKPLKGYTTWLDWYTRAASYGSLDTPYDMLFWGENQWADPSPDSTRSMSFRTWDSEVASMVFGDGHSPVYTIYVTAQHLDKFEFPIAEARLRATVERTWDGKLNILEWAWMPQEIDLTHW